VANSEKKPIDFLSLFFIVVIASMVVFGITLERKAFKKAEESSTPRPAFDVTIKALKHHFECEQDSDEVGLVCHAKENNKYFVYCTPIINEDDEVIRFVCRELR